MVSCPYLVNAELCLFTTKNFFVLYCTSMVKCPRCCRDWANVVPEIAACPHKYRLGSILFLGSEVETNVDLVTYNPGKLVGNNCRLCNIQHSRGRGRRRMVVRLMKETVVNSAKDIQVTLVNLVT